MNKFIVLVALVFTAVAAEDGYNCFDPDSTWLEVGLTSADINTADECKAACDTAVDAGETEANDWCCSSVFDSMSSELFCYLLNKATAEGDIRAAIETGGYTYSAWAWVAGVASADLTPVEETPADDDAADDDATEDDEDMSVRMTASAVAAASIAMLAM